MTNILTCTKFDFNITNQSLALHYKLCLDEKIFQLEENFKIESSKQIDPNYSESDLTFLCQSLHLLCAISYYKFFPQAKIQHQYSLTELDANFWNNVYQMGLGEFVYKNNLSFEDIHHFSSNTKNHNPKTDFQKNIKESAALVLFGGGKDSYTSLEILKKIDKKICLVIQNPKDFMKSQVAKLDQDSIFISRKMPSQIQELKNLPFALDGHIPITMIIEFITMIVATLFGYQEVIVSSEYSANFGNIKHDGKVVNHQWDKSYEAEVLLQEYLDGNLSNHLRVFSILRPLYDVAILKIFAKYDYHLDDFISCNRNFRLDHNAKNVHWCTKCSKCAFVFLALAPFVSEDKLLKIFGKNLLQDPELEQTFLDLCGFGDAKPFECVGTFEECNWAAFKLFQQDKFTNSKTLQKIYQHQSKIKSDFTKLESSLLSINQPHSLTSSEVNSIESILVD